MWDVFKLWVKIQVKSGPVVYGSCACLEFFIKHLLRSSFRHAHLTKCKWKNCAKNIKEWTRVRSLTLSHSLVLLVQWWCASVVCWTNSPFPMIVWWNLMNKSKVTALVKMSASCSSVGHAFDKLFDYYKLPKTMILDVEMICSWVHFGYCC